MQSFGNCIPFDNYNIPKDSDGLPLREACGKENFLKLYTSPEVAFAFEKFWNDDDGIQTKFVEFWRVVADKFKGN
jgi:hypothetical protein